MFSLRSRTTASTRTSGPARPIGCPTGPTRRGVSLIELVVLIAASAAVFAVAVVAFTRFLDASRGGQIHLERTVQTARLAEQFRRDVWAAREATQDTKIGKLTLVADDGLRVEYEIDAGALRRTAFHEDKPEMRDRFQLSGTTPLGFEIDSSKAAILLAPLKLHPVEGEDPHGKPLRIVATLARDRRFQMAEGR